MPTEVVRFLTGDEVLAIHEQLISVFGGRSGLRDAGLLESALHRPRTGYYPDLAEMAAALFESLIINHPFVDGNMRVAFFAADVFLRLNGWRLEVDAEEAHAFLTRRLDTGTCNLDHLLPWLREHVREHESTWRGGALRRTRQPQG